MLSLTARLTPSEVLDCVPSVNSRSFSSRDSRASFSLVLYCSSSSDGSAAFVRPLAFQMI